MAELVRMMIAAHKADEDAGGGGSGGGGDGGVGGAGGQCSSVLLSIGAVQEDLRVMLPFIVTACARYFGPRELVRVLPEIDAGMVLARAMLGNVPSALAPFVAACLEFGGDGESGGNVAEVGGGGASGRAAGWEGTFTMYYAN